MRRERCSRLYMYIISFIGWGLLGLQLFGLPKDHLNLIFFVLLALLITVEAFPLILGSGSSTLSFPVVYTIFLLYGLEFAIISYVVAVFLVFIIKKKPFRIIFFNPAQLALSFFLAVQIMKDSSAALGIHYSPNMTLGHALVKLSLIVLTFYIFNNLFVDLVLWLRPQPYSFNRWLKRSAFEACVAIFVFLYLSLMFLLGNQNRGTIDFWSFFFFFSPLATVSVVSSFVVKLKRERDRIRTMYRITTNLTRNLTQDDWMSTIIEELRAFLPFDASLLLLKTKDTWVITNSDGLVANPVNLPELTNCVVANSEKPIIYSHRHIPENTFQDCFSGEIHSFAYSPLLIEEELVGLWLIGRSRSFSFRHEERQMITMIANQLAIVKKTRSLLREQKNHEVLEERNRIARMIHDGIAQSLAGIILNLETAQKKYQSKPNEGMKMVDTSIQNLRSSLKEVRQSIYSLRPQGQKPISVLQTIPNRLVFFEKEHGISTDYQMRGTPFPISLMVEQVMFDIFQEALRNIVKHAKATHVHVLVSFQQEHVLLKVKDNGVGFSLLDAMIQAQSEPHFGILNMNELSDKLGATLHINSSPHSGTEIQIVIPKLEGSDFNDPSYVS